LSSTLKLDNNNNNILFLFKESRLVVLKKKWKLHNIGVNLVILILAHFFQFQKPLNTVQNSSSIPCAHYTLPKIGIIWVQFFLNKIKLKIMWVSSFIVNWNESSTYEIQPNGQLFKKIILLT
jgi:hypothetical protein